MRRTLRPRGFTLVELLVGAGVGFLVLLGITATFISQAQQYQSHASRRAVQANVRQAMSFVERRIRTAGYGVDPDRAIIAYDSFNASSGLQNGASHPDAIVVHSRDPDFRRVVTGLLPNQLSIDRPLQQPLQQGQILLILCRPPDRYVYVTVSATVAAGMANIPIGQVTSTDSPISAPNSQLFQEFTNLNDGLNNAGSAFSCLNRVGNTAPIVVKVERSAFYVASFDEDGDPATAGRMPYLMMHRGLDLTGEGTIDADDAVPVAEGIEQLQVAYILNTFDANLPPIVGVNGPVPANRYGEAWNTDPNKPLLGKDGYTAPSRLTEHPANIRQVRLTLVSRSPLADPQHSGDDMFAPTAPWAKGEYEGQVIWQQLENLEQPPPDFDPSFQPRKAGGVGGYYRATQRQAVVPKNLLMYQQFLPISFQDDPALGGG